MSPSSPTRDSTARLARSGAALAAATLLSGLVGYVFVLIVTRALGPREYGVLGSLLGVALLASVTATALQLELTRAVASGQAGQVRPLLTRSLIVSAITSAVIVAAAPVLLAALRLPDVNGVFGLAALLFSQTFVGGLQGIMLGRGKVGAFGVLLVTTALSRVLAALITVATDGGSTFTLYVASVTALPPVLLGIWLVARRPGAADGRGRPGADASAAAARGAGTYAGLVQAGAGAGALMLLLNADLLAGRAVLDDTASGHYAFLTIFGRVTFWGTNFIALWVFPHVAARSDTGRAERAAVGAIAAIGVTGVAVCWVFGRTLTRLIAGEAYLPAAGYAPAFSAAGALIAVVQLAIYVDVARARRLLIAAVALAGVALLALIAVLPDPGVGQVIAVTLGVLGVVAGLGLWSMHVGRARQAPGFVVPPESPL